jgi:hypothetical protein
MRTARSLYRCYLSCKDAFPTPDLKEELVKAVWNEACVREGAQSDVLLHVGEVASPFSLHMADSSSNSLGFPVLI